MSAETNIEWCDSTFNPWIGCTKVSPACDDCYAARSTPARTLGVAWGANQPRRLTSRANWSLPLRWNAHAGEFQAQYGRRQRVFCASLADVFDNEVPVQWRRDLFDLIVATPSLDWLLLTKRVGNARRLYGEAYLDSARPWPANVWIGATVCNQAEADRDIPKLLAVPAGLRFLSIEPMLERVYLEEIPDPAGGECIKPLAGLRWIRGDGGRCETVQLGGRIDWVICGGESGPKARPMHSDWARSLRDQCDTAGVPFLFKQWGEWLPESEGALGYGDCRAARWPDGTVSRCVGKKTAGRQLDRRLHDAYPGATA